MKKNLIAVGLLVALVAAVLILLVPECRRPAEADGRPVEAAAESAPSVATPPADAEGLSPASDDDDEAASADAEEAEPPPTPEEVREAAEEAAVEAFDALTDKWMEPSKNAVSMADVAAFVAEFAKVPPARQEECLQRALNLVPDANVMLLVGVLMDKSQPKEFAELVFNDILNRDEDVKKPVLQQILRDKTHPCHADAAWILDVTDEKAEKPAAEENPTP